MDDLNDDSPEQRRSGIYLLPNLFTTGTLFSGFSATLFAIEGRYTEAVVAVFLGMIFDALDGRVARWTNTQSDFGKEYDSLADMVCFGLAPAVVMYLWSLNSLAEYGRFGHQLAWTGAFFYTTMAALRLARFNVLASRQVDKKYFFGLPSPSAAAFVMGYVWVVQDFGYSGGEVVFLSLLTTIIAGTLMVSSKIRYPSFKDLKFSERIPFRYLLGTVLALILIYFDPQHFLPGIILGYVASGPIMALRQRMKARRMAPNTPG